MVNTGKWGRAILSLEGGPGANELELSFASLDRGEEFGNEETNPEQLLDIALRNCFGIVYDEIDGEALYYSASFFNHSCMPNAIRYNIGDLIFIRSSTGIMKYERRGDTIKLAHATYEGTTPIYTSLPH
jgi:hypothetical protein